MKKITFRIIVGVFFVSYLFVMCSKDNMSGDDTSSSTTTTSSTTTEASATAKKINSFIKTVMSDVYLWYNYLPNIDINYETDSKAYFKKLLYTDDKWSYITDDVTSWENSLNGVEKSYGYSLAFGSFVDSKGVATGNYFAIIEYVYPNTPASKAGLERGSIITQINGSNITKDNYSNLLSSDNITITKGSLTSSGISNSGTITMASEELNLDPVVLYKVIEKENHKIGYLFYAQFISDYNSKSLKTALDYFSTNQITDLILDLRYNPGGQISAAQYLCSSIAPQSVVTGAKTLVTFQWNDKYQDYWVSKKKTDQTTVTFDKAAPVQLGLSKVTVLTGSGTASAAELTITGLQPYMNVEMVGDTTYGKYTASITIKPEDYYETASAYTDFKNWGLQPIVLRYANANGVTNFKNGFAPTYYVSDQLLPAQPLGDLSEPLLKKAVENITGVQITALKSATQTYRFKKFDRASSKFDPIKRNMQLDINKDFTRINFN
jgi:C-terminal processing protease CtpA/Prc